MGKKRKHELDLDAEKSVYTSFVTAANSLSQMYTLAVQQQRKAAASASRQTLERVLTHVLREHGSAGSIPVASLVHFLQQEYSSLEHSDVVGQAAPVQILPFMASSGLAAGDESPAHDVAHKQQRNPSSLGAGAPFAGSPWRRTGQTGPAAMDMVEHSPAQPGPQQPADAPPPQPQQPYMAAPGLLQLSADGKSFGFQAPPAPPPQQQQHTFGYPAGGLH